jgi:hypothetical protein
MRFYFGIVGLACLHKFVDYEQVFEGLICFVVCIGPLFDFPDEPHLGFGLFGLIPECGILGFQFFFLYAYPFVIDVKDTPSAHPGAQPNLLSGHFVYSLFSFFN